MVQFTKLRLTGFKSFVDATELAIEPGVTGIVGPNGCGKSNLLEALRWCMGEGSAKQLRGAGMDDVIFAGTTRRPARNIAEVGVFISNEEKRAPGEFNKYEELEIVRRIERDSGSVYRINGKDHRARDVQTLFADLSTGARSNAIVSQGQVGALINAKPADRRLLLEEAAGITGLHSRRHEAELRLRAAETNLDRLEDVIGAIAGQLQGLKRQARQATRYRNVNEQIRQVEATVLHLRWQAASGELEAARETLAGVSKQVEELTAAAAALSTEQAEVAAELPPLRQAEAESAAALQRLRVALDGLDAEAEQLAERKRDAETRLAQIDADVAREEQFIADAAGSLERLAEEERELAAAQENDADDEARAKEAVAAAEAAVQELDAEVTALTERVASAEARRDALTSRVSELERRLESIEARAAEIAEKRKAVEKEREEGEWDLFLDAANRAVAEAEAALERAQAGQETAEAEAAAKQAAEGEARQALREAEEALSALRAEEAGLAKLLSDSGAAGDFEPVLGRITVAPGYEAALGAALGDDLQAALDPAAPVYWAEPGDANAATPLPGGAHALSEYVEAPPALGPRLTQVIVVDTDTEAEAFAPKLRQGQRLVSKEGGLWRWDGLTAKAGAPTGAALRLQQENRLKELKSEIAEAERALTGVTGQHEAAQAALSEAQTARKESAERVRTAFAELDTARQERSRRSEEVSTQSAKLASLEENAGRLTADREEVAGQLEEARNALAEFGEDDGAAETLAQKRAALAEKRAGLAQRQHEFNNLAATRQARAHRLLAIADEKRAWENRAENGQTQRAQLAERRQRTAEEIEGLASKPEALERRRSELLTSLEAAEAKRDEAAEALTAKESAAADVDRRLKATERDLADARETRGRAEGAVNQAAQALDAIGERIRERLSCAPEQALEHAQRKEDEALPPLGELETKLERLTRERENIGPVNLRAEQEAKELEEQIASYETEKEDLIKAIEKLRRGIASLNREGRERLLASFEVVNGHFQELFQRLFAGGKARLELVDSDDPLEAGLEIMASPSGKALQRLSLMSGGEKALAALALIFAVFQTNPAPICVLDEVDAPLDQTNVGRFCDLVDDIAEKTNTRFLIVTHNSVTMARVDRLFGVTMAEEGVSQLVSVDLHQAEALRETA